MTADFAGKEREFLDGLKNDTGRDLVEWMQAIAAQNLAHRNDIIDWLRREGFTFSRASWLERIHNNGGRPIYLDRSAAKPTNPSKRTREPAVEKPLPATATEDVETPVAKPTLVMPPETPTTVPAAATAPPATGALPDTAALVELIDKAKAFRPLAQYLLREIEKTLPGAVVAPLAAHVSISRPHEFAILAISPRELRLGLDLGERPFDQHVQRARFPNLQPRISATLTHMIVLTDARQVNAELMSLLKAADARVNG